MRAGNHQSPRESAGGSPRCRIPPDIAHNGQRRRRRCRETLRFVVMYFSLMHLTRLPRMLSVYISGYVLFSFSFYSFISTIFSLMIDFSHLILQAVHGHYVCLGCTFASSYTLLCTYDPEDVIHASLFEYYPCLK